MERIAPEFLALAAKYNVNVDGLIEAYWQPAYDTLAYAAAGQTQLVFFQNPVGQGTKTKADTNMVAAGQFPAGQKMLVTDIAIEMLPGVARTSLAYVTDIAGVEQSGWLEFNIGSKNYLTEAPIGKFPPKHRLDVFAAVSTTNTSSTIQLYNAQERGEIYQITPMAIPPNQNFNVTVNWPTAVALGSGTAGTMRVTLGGFLYRTAQ